MSVNIQEALAKAREVASKLGGRLPGASSGGGGATGGLYGGDAAGMKRGPDADLYGGDAYKRPAVGGAPAAAYGAPAASYGAPAAAYGAAATPGAAPAGGGKYSSAIASLISGRMGRGSFALPNNYEVEDMTIPTGRFEDHYYVREVQSRDMKSPPRSNLHIIIGLVGMVIGRGGETLRGIEEQSQAKVNIAKEHEATADGYRPVTLTGTREAIEVAKKMISERIDMDMARGRPGRREWGSGPNARTEEIKIHQDNVGTIIGILTVGRGAPNFAYLFAIHFYLIGKGALTLKEIQSKSNCRVFVQPSSQAPAGDMMRTVFLTGDDEMINKARIMIETLINEGARAAGIENPEAETGIKETLMIKVHRDALGLVIGRGKQGVQQCVCML